MIIRFDTTLGWILSELNNADVNDGAISISKILNLQTTLNGKAALSHSHVISDVSNLQTSLDGKAATIHAHSISDITNLQTTLDGKAASSHTQAISTITGLQTALDGKAPTVHSHSYAGLVSTAPNYIPKFDSSGNSITKSVIYEHTNLNIGIGTLTPNYKLDVIGTLNASGAITQNGTAVSLYGHTHSISNITNLQTSLDGKANSSHSHVIADVSNLQTTLNNKAALIHNHNLSDINDLGIFGGNHLYVGYGTGSAVSGFFNSISEALNAADGLQDDVVIEVSPLFDVNQIETIAINRDKTHLKLHNGAKIQSLELNAGLCIISGQGTITELINNGYENQIDVYRVFEITNNGDCYLNAYIIDEIYNYGGLYVKSDYIYKVRIYGATNPSYTEIYNSWLDASPFGILNTIEYMDNLANEVRLIQSKIRTGGANCILMNENSKLVLDNCVLIDATTNSIDGLASSRVWSYNSFSDLQYSAAFTFGNNWYITDLTIDTNVI